MTVKTASDIRLMEKACQLAAETLKYAGQFVKEGMTTEEIDRLANEYILSHGGIASCIGYHGYPKAICTSVNDVVCHGLPGQYKLRQGDMINLDVAVFKYGFHGDTSAMFYVGAPSSLAQNLSDCAYQAMHRGIEVVKAGSTTGDIGFAVDKYVRRKGFHVLKEIGGHGIGHKMHEDPFVPSFGKKGRGTKLLKWGTITVEPIVNETSTPVIEEKIFGSAVTIVRTADRSLSAQYEHTVLITDGKPVILTLI